MSAFDKEASISRQPAIQTVIEFTPEYSPKSVEGEGLEPIGLGVLLSTIERLSENCGEPMELGKLTAFYSFSDGQSFALEKQKDSIKFQYFVDVSRWSDLGRGFPNYTDEGFPMLPTREEITHFLTDESGVQCFGFRSQLTNIWEHQLKSLIAKEQQFQAASMSAMQIDVLLKSSQYPCGRMCLQFNSGSLWIWVTQDDNYCMIFVDSKISKQALGCVIHCGESFILN